MAARSSAFLSPLSGGQCGRLPTTIGSLRVQVQMPAQVSALLAELGSHLPALLGGNFVGIYLYGSLTQRAFNPRRSDIDCVVVTRRKLTDAQFRRIGAWLRKFQSSNPWTARLQMSFLIRDRVLTGNASACLYQFGRWKRSRSDGNPIIWVNILESGIVLRGPRPESFVPAITREILFEALKREVGYLREELVEKRQSKWRDVPFYRSYAVLTLCRILYTRKTGKVVSKPRAARWATGQFGGQWKSVIAQAVESDAGRLGRRIQLAPIRAFMRFTEEQVRTAICA